MQRAERARPDDEDDPFVMMSSRELERHVLNKYGLVEGWIPPAKDSASPKLGCIQRNPVNDKVDRTPWYLRVLMALGGGVAVIAPVAVILFFPGKAVNLIATCAAMVAFAFAICWVPELRARDVLALTAGYASVLVVFVGANTQDVTSTKAS